MNRPCRRSRRAPILLIAAAALFLASAPVSATIHVVGDLGDSGAPTQLRAIIGAAVPGDTILVPPGTITLLLGHLVIDKDLTIIGAGRHFTRLDGGGTTRVISVTAAAHVAIASLVIRNGRPAAAPFVGGGIDNQGVLNLVEVVVEDCASEGGGGIWNNSGATITMQAVTVQRNSTYGVTASGAGMTNWGTATIAQSTFQDNFTTGTSGSAQGGAIQSAGVLSLTNTTISGNYAGGNYGGGLHLIPSATSKQFTAMRVALLVGQRTAKATTYGTRDTDSSSR